MKLINRRTKDLIFFISEITTFILVYIFSMVSIWLFFSREYWLPQIVITLLILGNLYNISRYFIYTRIVMWKAQYKKGE
jgi:hypothetical protein